MGNEAIAAHDHTFVWGDETSEPFSSTTSKEFSICAQNGVRLRADKGIHLNATNTPIIMRDWDVFATNAPGFKAGIGRWGLYTETNTLVAGIPGDDVSGKSFAVAQYRTNGTPTTPMQVDQGGNLSAAGSITAASFRGNGSSSSSLSAASLTGSVPSSTLTAVPAVNLTGTISDARLPTKVALLNDH